MTRSLAQVAHLLVFLIYLSKMGSKDVIGVTLTFSWLTMSAYFNWMLLSFYVSSPKTKPSEVTASFWEEEELKKTQLTN